MSTTDIAEHKVKLKEVLKGSEGELIILQDFDQTKESLLAIANKYKDLTVTRENFEEGKTARAEIREMRYGLQNISKHNNELINKAKSEMKETMETLIEILKPTEDKIHDQIKAIEDEKKLEKERKEKEEAERVAKVNREIADARVKFEKLVSFGRTDDDIEQFYSLVDDLEERNSKEEFQEFGFEIDNLLHEYNDRLQELRDRVQKIKDDAEQEKKNQILKVELERRNKFHQLGLLENDGNYSYKGTVLHTSNIVYYTEKEFIEGLRYIEVEIKIIDDAEAKVKAEAEAKAKAEAEAEAKKKAEEEAKLKAERQKFEQEKAEFEAKKKSEIFEHRKKVLLDLGFDIMEDNGENDNFVFHNVLNIYKFDIVRQTDEEFNETLKQINDAIDRHKIKLAEEKKAQDEAELQAKIQNEREFNETVEKARKLGVSFNDLDANGPKQVVIDTLKERITQAEHLLTVEKKKALKEAGESHIKQIEPLKQAMITYFEGCKIEPEHENAVVEFENEIRASFKKLKNTIL